MLGIRVVSNTSPVPLPRLPRPFPARPPARCAFFMDRHSVATLFRNSMNYAPLSLGGGVGGCVCCLRDPIIWFPSRRDGLNRHLRPSERLGVRGLSEPSSYALFCRVGPSCFIRFPGPLFPSPPVKTPVLFPRISLGPLPFSSTPFCFVSLCPSPRQSVPSRMCSRRVVWSLYINSRFR